VQKWSIPDVDAVRTEKGKHVVVEIGGAEPITLRFHAGSKDTAEAILKKLERSIDISAESAQSTLPSASRPVPTPPTLSPIETGTRDALKRNTVHFAVSSPSIITRSEDGEEDEVPAGAVEGVALYDFIVNEGYRLWVLDRNNEDWWSCRNQHDLEGVVPASYIEVRIVLLLRIIILIDLETACRRKQWNRRSRRRG
jgi:actin cytoskeleton-regulatory complex protein SLA1